MIGRDPSSAPTLPRNPRGAWRCEHCEEWHEADEAECDCYGAEEERREQAQAQEQGAED